MGPLGGHPGVKSSIIVVRVGCAPLVCADLIFCVIRGVARWRYAVGSAMPASCFLAALAVAALSHESGLDRGEGRKPLVRDGPGLKYYSSLLPALGELLFLALVPNGLLNGLSRAKIISEKP